MADQIPPIVREFAAQHPEVLIHLSIASWYSVSCGKLVTTSTRQTRYPALVTCQECARLFNKDQQAATDPNAGLDPDTTE